MEAKNVPKQKKHCNKYFWKNDNCEITILSKEDSNPIVDTFTEAHKRCLKDQHRTQDYN